MSLCECDFPVCVYSDQYDCFLWGNFAFCLVCVCRTFRLALGSLGNRLICINKINCETTYASCKNAEWERELDGWSIIWGWRASSVTPSTEHNGKHASCLTCLSHVQKNCRGTGKTKCWKLKAASKKEQCQRPPHPTPTQSHTHQIQSARGDTWLAFHT